MVLGKYAKAVTSLVISLLLIIVQYVQGVYAGGIDGVEWLGLILVLFGPAGLVAALANTPLSPATKALVQHVSTVVIVVTQGIIGVYANGISQEEWLGIGLLLVSTLAVYFVPNAGYVPQQRVVAVRRNAVGTLSVLGSIGAALVVLAVVLLILALLKVFVVSWFVLLVLLVLGLALLFVGSRSRTF